MTIILVTGANRGIGFAIIQSAASRIPLATFIVGCRSVEAGLQAVEQLRQLGLKAAFDLVQIDIELDHSILDAVDFIEKKYGRLDGDEHPALSLPPRCQKLTICPSVLINNAAGASWPKSEKLADVRDNLNVVLNNAVTSNAVVTRAFSPLLRKSDHPRVIMSSSARGSLERTASRQVCPSLSR